MYRIKTWLRTCMLQDRFNNSAIVFMKKDVMINIENVIDAFASNNKYIIVLCSSNVRICINIYYK